MKELKTNRGIITLVDEDIFELYKNEPYQERIL